METIKMKKGEAADVFNGLVDVKDIKGKSFALLVSKNMTIIREALKPVEDAGKPNEEFMKLSRKVQQLTAEGTDEAKEKVAKLEEEHKDLIQIRKDQLEDVNTMLLEDIELELHTLSEEELPNEVTAANINKLIKIIK